MRHDVDGTGCSMHVCAEIACTQESYPEACTFPGLPEERSVPLNLDAPTWTVRTPAVG